MKAENENDKKLIAEAYKELINNCGHITKQENFDLIEKAFHFACKAHAGVRRRSGEPYIIHPISVAIISAKEVGLGCKSIVAALLHDVVEDTEYSVEDIENLFGKKIASLVDGLTKIAGVFDKSESLQAENFKKMLLTLSDDLRVILIKIADRLHNMRTLESMPLRKQIKISGETLFMYAPLAYRMGLYAIKSELEDLSLKYEHPEAYKEIKSKISKVAEISSEQTKRIISPIEEILEQNNISASVRNRTKSIYSIWNKNQTKDISYDQALDLLSIRVVLKADKKIPEKNQCWNIYSLVTDIYSPKPERIRDWISTPKTNGYEALHVTVMGPLGKWIEIQICTERMDNIANRGFATHKVNNKIKDTDSELDKWLKGVKEIITNPDADALSFIDDFKLNLYFKEIQVFSPKGEIITLPKDATALDFAYEIHSDLGDKCIGAKVNQKLRSIKHKLKTGDQVEIVTSEKQTPKNEWKDFVITAKAKAKIKDALKKVRKLFLKKGIVDLESIFKNLNYPLNSKNLNKIIDKHKISNRDELYYLIGKGRLNIKDIEEALEIKSQNKFIKYWKLQFSNKKENTEKTLDLDKKKTFLIGHKDPEIKHSIAKCCNPIPGDLVMAIIEKEEIIVHQRKCSNALKLMSSRGDNIIETEWTTERLMSFLTIIEIKGIDSIGIVNKTTNVISQDLNVNMRSLHFESHDGIFEGLIHLYVHSLDHLKQLTSKLIKIKGIDSIVRIQKTKE